ncbi:MAG: DivIVA domain-containing protein, partial [Nitriliruptorales bacterium]
MGAWIVVGFAALVGLAVTIVALFAPRGRPEPAPRRPLWRLPHPREVLRPGFRRALHGYDPAEVDAHLEAVAIAYAALHDA